MPKTHELLGSPTATAKLAPVGSLASLNLRGEIARRSAQDRARPASTTIRSCDSRRASSRCSSKAARCSIGVRSRRSRSSEKGVVSIGRYGEAWASTSTSSESKTSKSCADGAGARGAKSHPSRRGRCAAPRDRTPPRQGGDVQLTLKMLEELQAKAKAAARAKAEQEKPAPSASASRANRGLRAAATAADRREVVHARRPRSCVPELRWRAARDEGLVRRVRDDRRHRGSLRARQGEATEVRLPLRRLRRDRDWSCARVAWQPVLARVRDQGPWWRERADLRTPGSRFTRAGRRKIKKPEPG